MILSVGCRDNKKSNNDSSSSVMLDGTWVSGCISSNGEYAKQTLVLNNSQATNTASLYADAECSQDQEQLRTRLETEIVRGSTATIPADATKIDFINPKNFITAITLDLVALFNSISMYGVSNWTKDIEVEITGKSEDGTAESKTGFYSIFKVTGNTLCLGDDSGSNDSSSEDKRPTELLTGPKCLTKQ